MTRTFRAAARPLALAAALLAALAADAPPARAQAAGSEAPSAPGPAQEPPIRFTRAVTLEDRRFDVPMRLYLTVEEPARLLLTLAADLAALEAALPALLSRRDDDDCEAQTAVEVRDFAARGRDLVLEGRVEYRRFLCLGDSRAGELLRQTADARLRLSGRVEKGCLRMRVDALELAPDGATGALLDATGATDRAVRRLRADLDRKLRRAACIDLPAPLAAFGTEITGGHFRAGADGRLGAVLNAAMTVDAASLAQFLRLVAAEGGLDR